MDICFGEKIISVDFDLVVLLKWKIFVVGFLGYFIWYIFLEGCFCELVILWRLVNVNEV